MIILPEQNSVFIGIPRTGSMSMTQWLERAFRKPGATPYPVEALHDWHGTLSESVDASGYPLFHMWSFCVVRNPFDRLVSWAAAKDEHFASDPQAALHRLLTEEPTRWTLPQSYFAEGVSHVYRFENLPLAIEDLRERLRIPADVEFFHEHETERDHYRAYYDADLRALLAERYAADLALFDYRF